MKQVLQTIGINCFIAAKVQYNNSCGKNDFYRMLKGRLKGKPKKEAKEVGYFLRNELHYHFKEFAQYQN